MNNETGRRRKIAILHLVHGLRVGGAENALLNYIKALGNEEYEHYVYCFGLDGFVRKKIESIGVPVCFSRKRASIKQPIRFVVSLLLLIRNLMIFIKGRHIQIIQSHSGEANQLCVLIGKLAGLPAFPTVHSTMAFFDERNRWDLRKYLVKAVNEIVYRLAEKVLAVSQEIKVIVLRKYRLKDSKVLVLKNGIVLDDASTKPANLENEFSFIGYDLKILAVGRLVALKCYDTLIKAFAEAMNSGLENVILLIAGDGEERLRLEGLIQNMKLGSYVKLLGIRHDVIALMKSSDVFVLPSRYEGLSIAMIEAMACGLPIIGSDAPGIRGHIKNEQNGLIFPIGDFHALARRILQLAEDKNLRTRLSMGAKESFKREFDMRRNIRPLEMIFRKCATTTHWL